MSVYFSYVLQTQCSFLYYLWQGLGVCVKFFLLFRHYFGHVASLHFRLLVRHSSYWGGSPQNKLRVKWTCEMTLALAYELPHLSAVWSQLQIMGMSRSLKVDFVHFYFLSFIFIFLFLLFSISIFRTTQVRHYQSRCHISHNLMA